MITADELRRVVLALPEAEERETWGHPTFRARDKLFAAPETFGVPAYDAGRAAREGGGGGDPGAG